MTSETIHEDRQVLKEQTLDYHRALTSLMEELEAIDWYQQRVDATTDEELKSVLAHNRDEEVEHACMVLEWLRRRMPKFDEQLKVYLNAPGAIVEAEEEAMNGEAAAPGGDGSLGIGSLRR